MRFFLFAIIFGIVLSFPAAPQDIPHVPHGMVILRSKKADLERIAKFTGENILSAEYDADGMKIDAAIAAERCTWHGWDVESGTIISLTLRPKQPQKIDTSNLVSMGFDRVMDDTFREYYTNRASGVQYYVDHDNSSYRNLISVSYYPTAADSKRRCAGFPPFDAVSETYSLGDSPFMVTDFDKWDMGLLGNIGFKVKDSKSLKGFIFIYFAEKDFGKAKSFQERLVKYAQSVLCVPPDRFRIRLGGLRDENIIETFLLSAEQPDPTPRPKYSSPMVFGK